LKVWQDHPNYMAHMHLSLSLRPLTAAYESQITLSGILGEPRIIHILQLIQDQHGVATTLQHLVQK
jgi:steroid 5-alpha reductase family enzyme